MYGAKIKAIRTARGFTQEEVAAKINVAPNTYSKMEGDKRKNWDPELITKIAEALGVTEVDITSSPNVFISFQNSPSNNGAGTQHITISKEVLDLLKEQLAEKDRLIAELVKKLS